MGKDILTQIKSTPLRRGDRLFIEDISREEFQARSEKARKALACQGIMIGCVYHEPIQTGIIFVK